MQKVKLKHWVIIAGLSGPLASYAGIAEQELEACNKANASGNYNEAIQHASASINAGADKRKAYLCQARAYTETKDYIHAIEALSAADQLAKNNLDHIVTILLIGNNYKWLKDFGKAVNYYENARQLSVNAQNAYFEMLSLNNIGLVLEAKGDYPAAIESYLSAQKLAANNNERAECHAHLASAYSAMDNHEKAIQHQIKAAFIEEHSSDFDHYANAGLELGRIYIHAKQYVEAEKTLNKVLENIILNKDIYWEAKANYYLSLTKRGLGNSQEADLLLEKAQGAAKTIGASDLLEMFVGSGV